LRWSGVVLGEKRCGG